MTHLLLVDDDESNRLTLSALLEDDGFSVDCAVSFADATRLLESQAPAYDAILLDHSLGDGFGSDLIPLIRRVLPRAKVIAMSGSAGADRMRRAADVELPKGLHFPDFLCRLQAILSRSR
jgi:two-component system, response regulator RegA